MRQHVVALDFIGRCLNPLPRLPARVLLRSKLAGAEIPWEAVVEMANDHLVTPAIWVGLREQGLLDCVPSDVSAYLRELYRLNLQRNQALRLQALEAVRQLNAIGVEPLLLKGGAQLFANAYRDYGERVMTDLDLLVPRARAAASLETLRRLGYGSSQADEIRFTEHHHYAPLFRPGDYAVIEVHRELLFRTAAQLVPTDSIWGHTERLAVKGGVLRILSPTYRVLHSVIHSEIVDRAHERGQVPLRSLHELVSLIRMYNADVQWPTIRALLSSHGQGRILHAHIYLARRLLGLPTPARIGLTPGCIAHYARTRAKLRWSWVEHLDSRIQRFSAYNIARRYGGDGSRSALWYGRMCHSAHMLSKTGRQLAAALGLPSRYPH